MLGEEILPALFLDIIVEVVVSIAFVAARRGEQRYTEQHRCRWERARTAVRKNG